MPNYCAELGLLSRWKLLLIFSKGRWVRRGRWTECVAGQSSVEKEWHEWQQRLDEVEQVDHQVQPPWRPRHRSLCGRIHDGGRLSATKPKVHRLRRGTAMFRGRDRSACKKRRAVQGGLTGIERHPKRKRTQFDEDLRRKEVHDSGTVADRRGGCVDPMLYGPYDTDEERLREAKEITEEEDCCFSSASTRRPSLMSGLSRVRNGTADKDEEERWKPQSALIAM